MEFNLAQFDSNCRKFLLIPKLLVVS